MIAGAVAFPLILEYVERNRLGTAGAGMGLFGSTIRNGFTVFVGSYVLMWSIWFLPQAGDRAEVVFRQEQVESQVRDKLVQGGVPTEKIHLKPMHRPGVAGESSRHWEIRRFIDTAGDDHERLKDLVVELSEARLKLQRPALAPETRSKLKEEITQKENEEKEIRAKLAASSSEFKSLVLHALSHDLAPAGGEILAARSSDGGAAITLDMEFVDPVEADITRKSLFEALTFSEPAKRQTVVSELSRVLETTDLTRIDIAPIREPVNGARFVFSRDPGFVALESALVDSGVPGGDAYNLVSSLISTIRGFSIRDSASYTVTSSGVGPGSAVLSFRLEFAKDTPPVSSEALHSRFAALSECADARVSGDFPVFQVEFTMKPPSKRPAADSDPALDARLRELLPEAPKAERTAVAALARRIIEIAAARPLFLTAAQPVVTAGPADRQYDYFFSMQYFMIGTDVLAILVILLILHLEKRGVIVRAGALEDANR
jgi:hypothetical protein